jgi:rubrerythrin
MAVSAGSKSPWSVFAGAAMALVLSALVAVLLGSTLQRYAPEKYVKLGASVLFILFGVVLLISALRTEVKAKVPTPVPARLGPVARLVIGFASEFERQAASDYRRLAEQAEDQWHRDLFLHIAEEEESHLVHLKEMNSEHGHLAWEEKHPEDIESPQPESQPGEAPFDTLLADAIDHERRTAALYRGLAARAPLPAMKSVFNHLAAEEESHVVHLQEMASRA